MTPAFSIIGEAGDLTDNFAARLIRLSVTDTSTEKSDSCTIELTNADGKLVIPKQGHKLTISMGYTGRMAKMGVFIIDEVRLHGPPDVVEITGKSTPFTKADGFTPFHSRKSRSFDNKSLGEIVRTAAGSTGLTPAVDPSFDSIKIAHLDQTHESDMNLLTRLARDFQAVMKPTFGKLIFTKRGNGKTVSGQAMPEVQIDKRDCSTYSAQFGKRTKFKKVKTKYHDPEQAETFSVESEDTEDDTNDEGDTTYEHPVPYADEETAKQAASSIKDSLKRGAETVSVTISGRPDINAEGTLTLSGFAERMNGTWILRSVDHDFGKHGFTTTVQGENSEARALDNYQAATKAKKSSADVGWAGASE